MSCNIWKRRNEHPNVGDVSIRSRNGAPSRKGSVVNGQTPKASNNEYAPLNMPPPTPFRVFGHACHDSNVKRCLLSWGKTLLRLSLLKPPNFMSSRLDQAIISYGVVDVSCRVTSTVAKCFVSLVFARALPPFFSQPATPPGPGFQEPTTSRRGSL